MESVNLVRPRPPHLVRVLAFASRLVLLAVLLIVGWSMREVSEGGAGATVAGSAQETPVSDTRTSDGSPATPTISTAWTTH